MTWQGSVVLASLILFVGVTSLPHRTSIVPQTKDVVPPTIETLTAADTSTPSVILTSTSQYEDSINTIVEEETSQDSFSNIPESSPDPEYFSSVNDIENSSSLEYVPRIPLTSENPTTSDIADLNTFTRTLDPSSSNITLTETTITTRTQLPYFGSSADSPTSNPSESSTTETQVYVDSSTDPPTSIPSELSTTRTQHHFSSSVELNDDSEIYDPFSETTYISTESTITEFSTITTTETATKNGSRTAETETTTEITTTETTTTGTETTPSTTNTTTTTTTPPTTTDEATTPPTSTDETTTPPTTTDETTTPTTTTTTTDETTTPTTTTTTTPAPTPPTPPPPTPTPPPPTTTTTSSTTTTTTSSTTTTTTTTTTTDETTTTDDPPSGETNKDTNVGLVVGIIIPILVVGVIICMWLLYRSGKLSWPPKNPFSGESDSIRPQPIALKQFPQHCTVMLNIPSRLSYEYQLLATLSSDIDAMESYSVAQQPDNKYRNRYVNILPYDSTRVKLPLEEGDISDYINASYIKGYSNEIEYVASQGPKEETCHDFWQMVYNESIKVIVMVTQLEEQGKPKCHKYFPNLRENLVLDDITIRCATELHFAIHTTRTLVLLKGDRKRTIIHLHFREWPDFGCPSSPDVMLQFCQVMRHNTQLSQPGLTLVHCSAGVGRTGTLIALDILLQHMKENKKIDIFGTVYKLRKQRMKMVQSEAQYVYLYKCVKEALEDPSYLSSEKSSTSSLEPIYENLRNQAAPEKKTQGSNEEIKLQECEL